ncbi:MAG: GNAT family protein [Rhodoferax sp.]|uniref:GNAT family N-acetyltransferase n=1 Tax=Rhodoferax sp. TaxID=50421 RepID=UPI00261CB062|nr:GNAT family protein [Rhodoferax sp.]MDD5332436.1 GNAT family protein [Rhodoferax sp.]
MSALDVPVLSGSRCVLRALTLADAASMRQHADDEAVWRNLFEGFPRPYTLADAQWWCGARPASLGYVWGVDVGGQVVGCISVRPEDGWLRCNAEVGYWIGQAHWRRGITSEALALVTFWAWATLPEVTRLYAPIFAWNEGSQAVARKCGYVKEADLRRSAIKDGRVIDRVQWAAFDPKGH